MAIEIVDFPMNSMVDLSSSLCGCLPEGNNCDANDLEIVGNILWIVPQPEMRAKIGDWFPLQSIVCGDIVVRSYWTLPHTMYIWQVSNKS